MRADAQRNYDRIVEVARQVFREQGYDASLDLIAKQAGVGPGTLYRHFPSRDDLIDAVMQSWVDRVEQTADEALAHEGGPRERAPQLVRGVRRADQRAQGRSGQAHRRDGRRRLADPHQVPGAPGAPAAGSSTGCEAEDALREGVTPLQVARLVGGVATVADQSELDPAAVRPMLEVVADGLLR